MTEEAAPDATEGDRGVGVGVVKECGVGEDAGVFAHGDRDVAALERLEDERMPSGIELRKARVVDELVEGVVTGVSKSGITSLEFLRTESDRALPVVRIRVEDRKLFYEVKCAVGGGGVLDGVCGLNYSEGIGATVDLEAGGRIKKIGDCLAEILGAYTGKDEEGATGDHLANDTAHVEAEGAGAVKASEGVDPGVVGALGEFDVHGLMDRLDGLLKFFAKRDECPVDRRLCFHICKVRDLLVEAGLCLDSVEAAGVWKATSDVHETD